MPRSLRRPELVVRRRRRTIFRITLLVAFILFICAAPVFLLRAPFSQIKEIEVISPEGIYVEEVKKFTEDMISGNFLFVIPKRSVLFYPKEEIESELMNSFRRIESLDLDLKKGGILHVNLSLRKPISLWCEDGEGGSCYFLDEKGFIFDDAGEFSSGIYFVYKGNIEGSPVGSSYLDEFKFTQVKDFIGKVRDIGFSPTEVRATSLDSLDLSVAGGHILFSLEDNLIDVLANLTSLTDDPTLSILKDGELQVESVDLRYGKKIILKRKASGQE